VDTHDVKQAAARASDHPILEGSARIGYATSGVLHLLIAWIGLQIAFGQGGKHADQSGALASLAGNGLGELLLWIAVLGFLGLGLWQLADSIVGHPGKGSDAWGGRAKAAAKCVVYLVLAWSAFSFARGKVGSSSSSQTVDFTASLMAKPGGRTLVVVVGIVVIAVGVYHVVKGWTKRFLRDLEDHPGTWATRAGQIGYIAKGVALVLVGLLFVVAGLRKQPAEATGLDGALRTLRDQPFGTGLLVIVSLGLAAYGLYSFARARHAKV
jgi:hypothetical protein